MTPIQYKCISLWQPWASAVELLLKKNETRGWPTHYRGPLAIHAAKRQTAEQVEVFTKLLRFEHIWEVFHRHGYDKFSQLPFGCVLCVGSLDDCLPTVDVKTSTTEFLLGDYSIGRFAWKLNDIVRLKERLYVPGRQGFFNVWIP